MPFGAKITISATVEVTVEVAGGQFPDEAQKAIIEACAFWQAIPENCPMPGCEAPLVFTARHPQSYHYYGLRCLGPVPHEMNFGERKDHSSLYFKDDGWKDAHTGNNQDNEPAASQGSAAPARATTASPAGDKVDQGTIRMIQAVANGKPNKPNVDNVAKEFFSKPLADLTKDDAMAVLEYLKTL